MELHATVIIVTPCIDAAGPTERLGVGQHVGRSNLQLLP